MENKKENLWRSKLIGNEVFLIRIKNEYYIDKLLGNSILIGTVENLKVLYSEIGKELGKKK